MQLGLLLLNFSLHFCQEKKDAWSQYMSEVRKYKERLGDEEEKNRPLVK